MHQEINMKKSYKSYLLKTVSLLAFVLATPASLAGETLDRVMSSKKLVVASDANWPPQSFLNDNNEMDGFDVDVAKEIAARLGAEIEFVTPQWTVITAGNWNGRWDLSVGSMTPTKERAKVLGFPGVYYYTPSVFVVHADSAYQDKTELNGKRIGAGTATVFEQYLNKDLVIDAEGAPPFEYDVTTDDIGSYESSTVALDDLRLGDGVRIDAALGPRPTFEAAIKEGYPVRILGEPAFYEPLSAAVDLGDQEFHDKIAEIIQSMHEDGALTELSKKWYGVDYTKQ